MKLEGIDGPLSQELRKCGKQLLSIRVTEIVFYLACAIWLSYSMFSGSYLYRVFFEKSIIPANAISYYVVLMVAICELGVLVREGYQRRDAYALLALVLMCLGPFKLQFTLLLNGILLVFCARTYDVRRAIIFCSLMVGIALLVTLLFVGMQGIHDTVFGDNAFNFKARVRHCLGYLYPLYPSQCVFCLTCTICYLRGKRLTTAEAIALLVINYLMYRLSMSRLSFVLGCLLVIISIALRFLPAIPWLEAHAMPRIRKVLVWSFPLALVCSVGATLLYGIIHPLNIDFFEGMNVTFGGRPALGFNGLLRFGFNATGQIVPWQGNGLNQYGHNAHSMEYNYIDNLFLHVLVEEGWIYVLGMLVLLTLVAKRALETENDTLLMVLAITAVHFMVDDLSMYLHYNLLFFLIAGLYRKTNVEVFAEEVPATLNRNELQESLSPVDS